MNRKHDEFAAIPVSYSLNKSFVRGGENDCDA
jgi:hypothetical protein